MFERSLTRAVPLALAVALIAGPLRADDTKASLLTTEGVVSNRANLLVGKWKLTKGPNGVAVGAGIDMTAEFTREGKLILTVSMGQGPKMNREATYKIVGDELFVTVPGQKRVEKNKIVKLDAKEFIFLDKKQKIVFTRK